MIRRLLAPYSLWGILSPETRLCVALIIAIASSFYYPIASRIGAAAWVLPSAILMVGFLLGALRFTKCTLFFLALFSVLVCSMTLFGIAMKAYRPSGDASAIAMLKHPILPLAAQIEVSALLLLQACTISEWLYATRGWGVIKTALHPMILGGSVSFSSKSVIRDRAKEAWVITRNWVRLYVDRNAPFSVLEKIGRAHV